MSKPALVLGSIALLATGALVGYVVAESPRPPEVAPTTSEPEVVFRNALGETRTISASEAASRLEAMDAQLARRRGMREEAEASDAPTETSRSTGDPPPAPPAGRFARPDGSAWSAAELAEMARTSSDAGIRLSAIRELRRVDTDQSRAALREVLGDPATPTELRAEAAKALASPPNRDKIPEELVAALAAEKDPTVRRELALGVGKMRERDAWMGEIAALFHEEKDPEVRKPLFEALLRDVRDPTARAELVGVAADAGASLEERRAALGALRGQTDAETVAKASALLVNLDARLREHAVAIVASAKSITPADLAAALSDADPGVGRAALDYGAQRIQQFGSDKSVLRADYERLVDQAVRLAADDAEASVRRAAVLQARSLPKDAREQVLAAGRNDPDLYVKLTSYSRSGDAVAKQGTPLYVDGLAAADAGVRDFAYRQLQRYGAVAEPFDARWNAKARAAAIEKIRLELAAKR